ncbi:MAG TPA: hypothetical protein VGO50_08705 [Pyrinomonadaceae bacterium]|nr:hypothetical protein [Pyrinomonadaceae bacterium]
MTNEVKKRVVFNKFIKISPGSNSIDRGEIMPLSLSNTRAIAQSLENKGFLGIRGFYEE